MAFTLDPTGLMEFMTETVYRNITEDEGGDDVAIWSINLAKILVTTKFNTSPYIDQLDWDNEIIIIATLQYAVYYLYDRIEASEAVLNKRLDGNVFLASILGNYAYDIPQNGGSGGKGGGGSEGVREKLQSVIKVKAGPDNWNGFGGSGGYGC